MGKVEVTLTFVTELLGTAPSDKEIYSSYIAAEAVAAGQLNGHGLMEELDSLPADDKGRTVFHRNAEGKPILFDYQIKGFMKESCGMQARFPNTLSKGLKAYKKLIDGMVFVWPRHIEIEMPAGAKIGTLERPLRAQTAQGERVALACSEMIPSGSKITFEIESLNTDVIGKDMIKEWLNYGRMKGLGQWRNGSYGRFRYSFDAFSAEMK